jgi:hypothetical protein
MKTHTITKTILVIVAMVLLAVNAWADAIYLGEINFSPGSPDPKNEQAWLENTLIPAYNSNPANSTDLPTPIISFNSSPSYSGQNLTSITVNPNGADYIVLHWGGNGGGVLVAYAFTSDASVTFTLPGVSKANSLFGYNLFYTHAVPVPAAAWLLGTGLVGLIGVRRKMKK